MYNLQQQILSHAPPINY